jgi:hypothetical protein
MKGRVEKNSYGQSGFKILSAHAHIVGGVCCQDCVPELAGGS